MSSCTKLPLFIKRPFLIIVVFLMAGMMLAQTAHSQTIVLDRMPASVVNQPDFDLYDVRRPALSMIGFDNTEAGYNPNHGLGLKQILSLRFNQNDPLVRDVFARIIELAHEEQIDPYVFPDNGDRQVQLDINTNILQARAFEAITTLVLELNGYTPSNLDPTLRSHDAAMAAFREALVTPAGGVLVVGDELIFDFVRWGRSIGNVARAVDLYLAMENAYIQFIAEVNPAYLLSLEERAAVFEQLGTALIGDDMVLGTPAVALYESEIDLPPEVIELILMLLEHRPEGDRLVAEVEPGNWALKQRTAIGYGSLAMQAIPGSDEEALLLSLLPQSLNALDLSSIAYEEDRLKSWNFMTYGGKRFWAESTYYLDWTMEQVVPFFHAMRANDLMPGSDPFFNPVFLNPMDWLTDTVTPDGRFMPLDDANKQQVRYCGMLRWIGTYGDADLGEKCAWIENKLNGPARRDEVLLVEIAIPRTKTMRAPALRIGNAEGPLIPNVSEQQLVLREKVDQKTHYMVLNGEHDKAVDRGEGHEQADQLQLLYYVDDVSYLMDSGYDRGATVENSSWNHYYDHNVLTAGIGEGGLRAPELRILEVRKTSEPRFLGEVDALYTREHGEVTVFHGEQKLTVMPKSFEADYTRDVLFVNDASPYVIDFNRIKHRQVPVRCDDNLFAMNYHVNSNTASAGTVDQKTLDYVRWDNLHGASGKTLNIFPMSIEFDAGNGYINLVDDEAQERQTAVKERVDIQRLTVANPDRCVPYWSIASIIQANAPAMSPTLLWSYQANTKKQGWIWPKAEDVYDVFIARSVETPTAGVEVNPSYVDAAFPNVVITLPANTPYGFARLEFEDGTWQINPNYDLYLDVEAGDTITRAPAREALDNLAATPAEFKLFEPYPNPSNPVASIRFTLPVSSAVQLVAYDLLGRRAQVIVDGPIPAGEHTLQFNGTTLPSGTYLIQLKTDFGSQTKRLLLLK